MLNRVPYCICRIDYDCVMFSVVSNRISDIMFVGSLNKKLFNQQEHHKIKLTKSIIRESTSFIIYACIQLL